MVIISQYISQTIMLYTFIFYSAICQLCVCVLSCSVVSKSMQPHGLQPARLLCPWNFPGKNTGVDCHFLLQGIFLTQGSNPCLLCLLYWQADSLLLAPPGKTMPIICRLYFNNFGNFWKNSEIKVRLESQGKVELMIKEGILSKLE